MVKTLRSPCFDKKKDSTWTSSCKQRAEKK